MEQQSFWNQAAANPAHLAVVDPDGTEVYRYQGRDFADRTNDDDLWEADAWRDHIEV